MAGVTAVPVTADVAAVPVAAVVAAAPAPSLWATDVQYVSSKSSRCCAVRSAATAWMYLALASRDSVCLRCLKYGIRIFGPSGMRSSNSRHRSTRASPVARVYATVALSLCLPLRRRKARRPSSRTATGMEQVKGMQGGTTTLDDTTAPCVESPLSVSPSSESDARTSSAFEAGAVWLRRSEASRCCPVPLILAVGGARLRLLRFLEIAPCLSG